MKCKSKLREGDSTEKKKKNDSSPVKRGYMSLDLKVRTVSSSTILPMLNHKAALRRYGKGFG